MSASTIGKDQHYGKHSYVMRFFKFVFREDFGVEATVCGCFGDAAVNVNKCLEWRGLFMSVALEHLLEWTAEHDIDCN